jgi:hypothetical protein
LSSVNTFYLGRRLNFCSRSSARSAFMHAGPPSAMHDGFRASPGIRPVGACSRPLPTRSAGPPTAEAPAGTPTAGAGRFRMGREHHGGGATLSTPLVSHKRPSPKRQTPLPPSPYEVMWGRSLLWLVREGFWLVPSSCCRRLARYAYHARAMAWMPPLGSVDPFLREQRRPTQPHRVSTPGNVGLC